MRYLAVADTDAGISKEVNQDSVLIKHAGTDFGEIVLAVVCDGMGGLSKGELASATVIREFAKWFDDELPYELDNLDLQVIGCKWDLMIKDLNGKISEYGQKIGMCMGTTFTGILLINDKYLIGHVGDTRVYHLNTLIKQLTTDQTFVAREISRGTLTREQARTDKRRNMLLQCVGACDYVEPDILTGTCERGAYMLCSDGFRHKITESEMFESLRPVNLVNREVMHANVKYLIEQNKYRQEEDNISVILIRVFEEAEA